MGPPGAGMGKTAALDTRKRRAHANLAVHVERRGKTGPGKGLRAKLTPGVAFRPGFRGPRSGDWAHGTRRNPPAGASAPNRARTPGGRTRRPGRPRW